MKHIIFYLILITAVVGCSNDEKANQSIVPDMHTSKNALDVTGTYSGITPCASCEGIDTQIMLTDSTYTFTMTYLGEDEPNHFQESGTYHWNEAGNSIIMNDKEMPNQFFVGENVLIYLDQNGERITGTLADKYVLHKQ